MTIPDLLEKKAGLFCDTLGESIKYVPAAGPTLNLNGIFSDEKELSFTGSVTLQKTIPIVKVRSKLVAGIARNDTIIIIRTGTSYKVMRFEIGAITGETKIFLKES